MTPPAVLRCNAHVVDPAGGAVHVQHGLADDQPASPGHEVVRHAPPIAARCAGDAYGTDSVHSVVSLTWCGDYGVRLSRVKPHPVRLPHPVEAEALQPRAQLRVGRQRPAADLADALGERSPHGRCGISTGRGEGDRRVARAEEQGDAADVHLVRQPAEPRPVIPLGILQHGATIAVRSWRHATAWCEGACGLPDSAFAYIDSRGRRRLPIHDATRVRNALARFSQVVFEDEAARDRARTRLLRAAKKHGIVPIGFVSAQLNPQRKLPTGRVTFLLTDIEGSTELLGRLEDDYAALLADVRRRVRAAVRRAGGREVDARADDLFAVFEPAPAALAAALAIQQGMRDARSGRGGLRCGCGSACTAAGRRCPRPATSASPSTPQRGSRARGARRADRRVLRVQSALLDDDATICPPWAANEIRAAVWTAMPT